MKQAGNMRHELVIDAWLEKAVAGISPEHQYKVFCQAVLTLRSRTVITLSSVTWNAVLDRALHQGQQLYPLLLNIKMENGLIVQDTDSIILFQNKNKHTVLEPIRFLLIELFTIIENLTGGILTEPLYKELAVVLLPQSKASGGTGRGQE